MVSNQRLLSLLNALEKDLIYTRREIRACEQKRRNLNLVIDGLKQLGTIGNFNIPCCSRMVHISPISEQPTTEEASK